jgi:hypothetical protein
LVLDKTPSSLFKSSKFQEDEADAGCEDAEELEAAGEGAAVVEAGMMLFAVRYLAKSARYLTLSILFKFHVFLMVAGIREGTVVVEVVAVVVVVVVIGAVVVSVVPLPGL